ncbi:MAG: hypothetical protein NT029_15520 [Armatimonadetes bacterium]|nr:hypothetical protein [Armatimonadota bacterium]
MNNDLTIHGPASLTKPVRAADRPWERRPPVCARPGSSSVRAAQAHAAPHTGAGCPGACICAVAVQANAIAVFWAQIAGQMPQEAW